MPTHRPWSRRDRPRTPPPADARTALVGRRPGTTPPTPTDLRACRAHRVAWSTGPDGPAPRRRLARPAPRSPETPSCRLLDGHRLTRDDKHHPIATGGQLLVEDAEL